MIETHPWHGFWQIGVESTHEETVPFRNTTTTERLGLGFVLYTRGYFMEFLITGKRHPPAQHPPSDEELAAMFRAFHCTAGRCRWNKGENGWQVTQKILVASDPSDEGKVVRRLLNGGSSHLECQSDAGNERWRKLSGAGESPLSGVWENRSDVDRWLYFTCAGHYGILRVDLAHSADNNHPKAQHHSFGANMGARLETASSFDHWPMVGQVFGYDVRKHETFKLEEVKANRFIASIPTFNFPASKWTRLE